jgi:hypothetical protein
VNGPQIFFAREGGCGCFARVGTRSRCNRSARGSWRAIARDRHGERECRLLESDILFLKPLENPAKILILRGGTKGLVLQGIDLVFELWRVNELSSAPMRSTHILDFCLSTLTEGSLRLAILLLAFRSLADFLCSALATSRLSAPSTAGSATATRGLIITMGAFIFVAIRII